MDKKVLLRDISVLYRGANAHYHSITLGEYALQGADPALLAHIDKHNTIEQDLLVKHFMMDRATITKALDRLEKNHLVCRSVSTRDKRAKVVTITEDGIVVAKYFGQAMEKWSDVILKDFTPEEKAVISKLCNRAAINAWNHLHQEDKFVL